MKVYVLVVLSILLLAVGALAALQNCSSCEECTALAAQSNIGILVASNLSKSERGDCIAVKGRNVTIDCNGKFVAGFSEQGYDAIRILEGAGGVAIKNCSVSGADSGIGIMNNTGDVTITKCRIIGILSSGIYAENYGSNLMISDNFFPYGGSDDHPKTSIYLNLLNGSDVGITRNTYQSGQITEIIGSCDPQKLRIWDNDFNVTDCGQLWHRTVSNCGFNKKLGYSQRYFQIESIRVKDNSSASGYKTLKCTETARLEPILKLKLFTTDNELVAYLRIESNGQEVPLSQEQLTISIGGAGGKNITKTTSAEGDAMLFAGDEEMVKLIRDGGATATFNGNSYFSPKTVNVEFVDEARIGSCTKAYGGDQGVLDVVFISLDPRDYVAEMRPGPDEKGLAYFNSDEEFKKYVLSELADIEGDGNGILSTKPFAENKVLFNFWIYNGSLDVYGSADLEKFSTIVYNSEGFGPIAHLSQYSGIRTLLSEAGCPADTIVFVVNGQFRSTGGDIITLSVQDSDAPKVLTHEFGHAMGLSDEYTEFLGVPSGSSGVMPSYPGVNCADTIEKARAAWGDLVGNGSGDFKVGYFTGNSYLAEYVGAPGYQGLMYSSTFGCSYTSINIRPTVNSIMKFSRGPPDADWYRGFGLVNERILSKTLEKLRTTDRTAAGAQRLTQNG